MSLPTTNLTMHQDASTNTHLFSDDAGTVQTTDGGTVRNWKNETDASVTTHFDRPLTSDTGPDWHSTSLQMKNPYVTFPGTRHHYLEAFNSTDSATQPFSNYVSATAATLAIVFYATTITGGGTTNQDCDILLASQQLGLYVTKVSGVAKVRGWNTHTTAQIVDVTGGDINRTWIAILTHDSATLTVYVIDDGGNVTSGNISVASTDSLADVPAIGDTNNNASQFPYTGNIGEFVAYNAVLSGSDMTNLQQYFITKWLNVGGVTWDWMRQNERPIHYSKWSIIDSGPRPGRGI